MRKPFIRGFHRTGRATGPARNAMTLRRLRAAAKSNAIASPGATRAFPGATRREKTRAGNFSTRVSFCLLAREVGL